MTANTVVINNLNTSEVLQTVNIVDVADVTFPGADNQGEYVYGLITFYSPQIVPDSGGYIVISASGRNEYMTAVQYDANYSPVGAGAGSIDALAGTLTGTVDGTMVDVAAAACAGGATPTAAQVDTAVEALSVAVNLQLKELMVKVNELVAAG